MCNVRVGNTSMSATSDQAKKSKISQNLQYVKGVGPQRHRLLQRLGVGTIEELMYFFPRRYEDRSQIVQIQAAREGEKNLVAGEIQHVKLIRTRRGPTILRVVISDGTAECHGLWFNVAYMEKNFQAGQHVVFYGKADRKKGVVHIHYPDYESVAADGRKIHTRRIVPFYSLTQELSQRVLRSLQYQLLVDGLLEVDDPLPTRIRDHHGLENRRFALKEIHFPSSIQSLEKAYRRLVFDEFLATQITLAFKKRKAQKPSGSGYAITSRSFEDFNKLLPFKPTADQARVAQEIVADLCSDRPMQRLLQGDVGSGKTTLAAFALYATIRAGFQGALMVPTEILAQQHYLTLSRLLSPAGISVSLLTQGQSAEEKEGIIEGLRDGSCGLVVGTHALVQDKIQFSKLGMIVIDEQHKFGVVQRRFLEEKSQHSNLLMMTATPIPRTLALTLYGDMDLSVMNQGPRGRGRIETVWLGSGQRNAAYDFIKQELSQKRQAFVVCPAVEQSKQRKLQAVTVILEDLRRVFSEVRVELLHGQLKAAEKKSVMQAFTKNEIQVLVATTVIEVGIDVPNATVMVVENAENFGLSQLHQLRGRIGRGKHDSTCILISDAEQEATQSRLNAFVSLESGFDVAEEDLKLRGPGDFAGNRQHGIPQLRIGDLIKDFSILDAARKEAFQLVEEDPELTSPHHQLIRQEIKSRFGDIVL